MSTQEQLVERINSWSPGSFSGLRRPVFRPTAAQRFTLGSLARSKTQHTDGQQHAVGSNLPCSVAESEGTAAQPRASPTQDAFLMPGVRASPGQSAAGSRESLHKLRTAPAPSAPTGTSQTANAVLRGSLCLSGPGPQPGMATDDINNSSGSYGRKSPQPHCSCHPQQDQLGIASGAGKTGAPVNRYTPGEHDLSPHLSNGSYSAPLPPPILSPTTTAGDPSRQRMSSFLTDAASASGGGHGVEASGGSFSGVPGLRFSGAGALSGMNGMPSPGGLRQLTTGRRGVRANVSFSGGSGTARPAGFRASQGAASLVVQQSGGSLTSGMFPRLELLQSLARVGPVESIPLVDESAGISLPPAVVTIPTMCESVVAVTPAGRYGMLGVRPGAPQRSSSSVTALVEAPDDPEQVEQSGASRSMGTRAARRGSMVDYVAALDPGELAAQMAAANKTYDEAVVTQLERVADSAVQQVQQHMGISLRAQHDEMVAAMKEKRRFMIEQGLETAAINHELNHLLAARAMSRARKSSQLYASPAPGDNPAEGVTTTTVVPAIQRSAMSYSAGNVERSDVRDDVRNSNLSDPDPASRALAADGTTNVGDTAEEQLSFDQPSPKAMTSLAAAAAALAGYNPNSSRSPSPVPPVVPPLVLPKAPAPDDDEPATPRGGSGENTTAAHAEQEGAQQGPSTSKSKTGGSPGPHLNRSITQSSNASSAQVLPWRMYGNSNTQRTHPTSKRNA